MGQVTHSAKVIGMHRRQHTQTHAAPQCHTAHAGRSTRERTELGRIEVGMGIDPGHDVSVARPMKTVGRS
jgi:hypothetical protein